MLCKITLWKTLPGITRYSVGPRLSMNSKTCIPRSVRCVTKGISAIIHCPVAVSNFHKGYSFPWVLLAMYHLELWKRMVVTLQRIKRSWLHFRALIVRDAILQEGDNVFFQCFVYNPMVLPLFSANSKNIESNIPMGNRTAT